MNWKTTLVLAILAVGGGLAVLFTSNKGTSAKPAEDVEKTEHTSIFEKKPDKESFVKAALERPGQPKLSFERSGEKGPDGKLEGWSMVEPAPGPADGGAVDSLVFAAIELEPQRSFKPGEKGGLSAADAGFDAP